MDWNEFCDNLKEVLELKRYTDTKYIKWDINNTEILIEYYFEQDRLIKFKYSKRKFVNDYKNMEEVTELKISNEKYYEVPISFKNEAFPIMPRYDRVIGKEYNDNENNLRYKISNPSKQFWLKMVELKIKPNAIMMLRRLSIHERNFKFKEGIVEKDIFELLGMVYRDCITLQIFSMDSHREEEFSKLADAFIFNINYNTDVGIRQTYDIENVHERRRNNRFRNESIEKISAPKKIYKKELIEQYNMASISEEPFIKYLCYYHILEHFYEAVYKEELVKTVKERLAFPSFSIKKDSEIIKLIEIIKTRLKYDRDSFDGNELEALELVLKKYIKIETLKIDIKNINEALVDYYNNEKVKFSGGIPINFNDIDNVYKNMSKRIYFTRNALVHYKSNNFSESDRGIYSPFRDREELLQEIPLIRILAENVIINDAHII